MPQKTFSFTKRVKDLTHSPKFMANRIRVGNGVDSLVFTMIDCHEVAGHDDTLPYEGTLVVNGTPMYHCFNDGWGGETEITLDRNYADYNTRVENIIHQFKWKYGKCIFDLKLDFIADILAITACYTK